MIAKDSRSLSYASTVYAAAAAMVAESERAIYINIHPIEQCFACRFLS